MFAIISLAEGLGWGWESVQFAGAGNFGLEMLVMLVCLAVASGSVSAFAFYLPAFWAIFLPTTLPYAFASFTSPNGLQHISLGLMLVFIPGIGAQGVLANRAFNQVVRLRLQASELAADLRIEKDIAEAANRAKSAFLAAASHDLRQPVHALGLFIGALEAMDLPPEGARIVERSQATLSALDDLFAALLDISRLDAGLVSARSEVVDLMPLLDRLAAEFVGEAQAKGLTLRIRRTSVTLRTDPLLLERILRNLISNAVRHTRRGGVRRRLPGRRRSAH